MIKNKKYSQHYKWEDNCSGWSLEDTEDLCVIHEMMPPNISDVINFYEYATNLLFILDGEAEILSDSKTYSPQRNYEITIKTGTTHFIKKISSKSPGFLVISTSSTKIDRTTISRWEIK